MKKDEVTKTGFYHYGRPDWISTSRVEVKSEEGNKLVVSFAQGMVSVNMDDIPTDAFFIECN